MKSCLPVVLAMLLANILEASAQDGVKSEGQSGGVTAGSIGTLNQNFGRTFRSPYLKELQDFYFTGSQISRSWMSMPSETKDADIVTKANQSAEWVNSCYAWIRANITPAAAERFLQITPTNLSSRLGGDHSADAQNMHSGWAIQMPMYLSNLNALMSSDEMYPQTSVTFQFYLGPGNYEPGSDVAGFKWKHDDTDTRIIVFNPTSITYTDFDAYISTNLSIENAGVVGWGTSCSVASYSPVVSSIVMQGKPFNPPPIQAEAAGGISPTYRIHCDKIIPGSNHEIVLAVIAQKPVPFGGDMTNTFFKKAPDWVATRFSYDAPGSHHDEKADHCFASQCVIPPNATYR